MKRALVSLAARVLHALAFALWLGGLVAIGALVAPTAFHVLRAAPALAGGVVGGSLRLFNVLCLFCGIVMLACDFALGVIAAAQRTALICCIALTGFLLLLTGYLGWLLFPALDAAQAQGRLIRFAHLHALYEHLSLWEIPLLLLLLIAATLRDQKGTVNTPQRPQLHR